MKRTITLIILSFCFFYSFSQHFGTSYEIIGKGASGEKKCKGSITECPPNSILNQSFDEVINIYLSDMLNANFKIVKKQQVDDRTIKLLCIKKDGDITSYIKVDKAGILSSNYDEIIKYKCPYGKNVYFFTFPPLYEGQGKITYKTIKNE